jgi:hypothetical protein
MPYIQAYALAPTCSYGSRRAQLWARNTCSDLCTVWICKIMEGRKMAFNGFHYQFTNGFQHQFTNKTPKPTITLLCKWEYWQTWFSHLNAWMQAMEQIELGSGSSEIEEVTVVEMVDPIRFYVHTGMRKCHASKCTHGYTTVACCRQSRSHALVCTHMYAHASCNSVFSVVLQLSLVESWPYPIFMYTKVCMRNQHVCMMMRLWLHHQSYTHIGCLCVCICVTHQ